MDAHHASPEGTQPDRRSLLSLAAHRLTFNGREIPLIPFVIALLTSIFVLFTLGFLIAYGMPMADDFRRGTVGWQNAIFYADSEYMHWTGRWTSQVIEPGLFSSFDLYHSVPFILAVLFSLRLLALIYLFRHTLTRSRASAACLSTLFVVTWLSVSPGIGESTLWATGAVEYELSLSVAMFAIAMISQSKWIAAGLMLAVAVTMHELIALVLTGTCVNMIWMHRQDSRRVRPLVLLTLASAILTIGVLLAPGNFERSLQIDWPTHKLLAFIAALVRMVISALVWTTSPVTIGLLLFVIGTCEQNRQVRLLNLIGWPCVIIGLVLAIAAIVYGGPARVQDLLCFVYLLFLIYAAAWFAPKIKAGRRIRIIALLLFSFGAVTSGNVREMVGSAFQAPEWRKAVLDRRTTHHFDRISWPHSYFRGDVTSDDKNWNNTSVAKYLGIASVSCPSCEPPPDAKR